MVRIQLDSDTCRRLGSMEQAVELCDGSGRVIGFFLPERERPGRLPEGFVNPFTDDEVARLRGVRQGRTLDEIVESLPDGSDRR